MDKLRPHLVTITAVDENPARGKVFQAYLRENFEFDVNLHYDTIFRDVLRWREGISKVLVATEELERIWRERSSFAARVFGTGVAWTRKFGGVPEHIEFTLPCRLWVEDKVDDVMSKLSVLYDMSVPELGAALSVYTQHKVMIAVGNWFILEEAIITQISHKWSDAFTEGVPSWCDVDISVSTIYAVDRKQLTIDRVKISVSKWVGRAESVEVR